MRLRSVGRGKLPIRRGQLRVRGSPDRPAHDRDCESKAVLIEVLVVVKPIRDVRRGRGRIDLPLSQTGSRIFLGSTAGTGRRLSPNRPRCWPF